MALWGKKDDIYSAGTITVDYANKTVTGSGTTFTALSVGDVISIGAGITFGEAVVSGITSDTVISIASTEYLSGSAISDVEWTASQKPKYSMQDSNYSASEILGVDENEIVSSTLEPSHTGWVGVHTYVDNHGNLRRKTEVLVAMSGITTGVASTTGVGGDAADDTLLPDTVISILTQPSSVGVATTALPETVNFSVVGATSPASQALTYQWQVSTNGGTSYSNVGGATTSAVSIAVTDTSYDGNLYRVVLDSTGAAQVISDAAEISVNA
jgi:hypothetical protein